MKQKLRVSLLRAAILLLLALPLLLIPVSFGRYPDIVLYDNPGITLEEAGEYADEFGVAAVLTRDVYMTDSLFLEGLELPFLIGAPYDSAMCERGDQVIVVSGSYALEHFFSYDILGRTVAIGSETYRVCGVFDDQEFQSFAEVSAGIDLSEVKFIPYTSVVGWQSKSVECCVVSAPLSPDATELLAWCDSENISEYQNSLWRTAAMIACVILFLHGIVATISACRRKSLFKYLYLLLVVGAALTFVCLWGTMDAEVIPVSGNVFDIAYYCDRLAESMRSLIDGSAPPIRRLYGLCSYGLFTAGAILMVVVVVFEVFNLRSTREIMNIGLKGSFLSC